MRKEGFPQQFRLKCSLSIWNEWQKNQVIKFSFCGIVYTLAGNVPCDISSGMEMIGKELSPTIDEAISFAFEEKKIVVMRCTRNQKFDICICNSKVGNFMSNSSVVVTWGWQIENSRRKKIMKRNEGIRLNNKMIETSFVEDKYQDDFKVCCHNMSKLWMSKCKHHHFHWMKCSMFKGPHERIMEIWHLSWNHWHWHRCWCKLERDVWIVFESVMTIEWFKDIQTVSLSCFFPP